MEKLINLMQNIESTTLTNDKKAMFVSFFEDNTNDENYMYLKFLSNTILPEPQKLNIGDSTVISALSQITGYSDKEIIELKTKMGNLSSAAEYCFEHKKQMSFFEVEPQNIDTVLRLFQELPTKNKVAEKITNLIIALSDQTPKTVRYLCHFVLGGNNLSIGYKNKLLLNAIADYRKSTDDLVHKAYTYTNSVPESLIVDLNTDWKLELHFPYKPQLADKDDKPFVLNKQHLDYKYDGGRIQAHADTSKVSFFTRNIENVTEAFPDVSEPLKEWVLSTGNSVILDGEFMVGDNFKAFGNRVKRKYDIEEYAQNLPAKFCIFDILYLNGEELIDKSLTERREILKSLDLPEDKFEIVKYEIFTSHQQLNKLYEQALEDGYEGVMIKEDSIYELNNRSTTWRKLKPTYPADLVIDSAEYGTGRNAGKLSSFILATYEGHTIGKVGIGIPDDMMDEIGELIKVQDVVLEVAYESLQVTDKYTSGFAMRFPRVIAIRKHKSLEELTTLEQMKSGVNFT